jgi:hypothetical protein
MTRFPLPLLLLAFACSGDDKDKDTSPDGTPDGDSDTDTDADADTDADTDTDCSASITSVTPADASTMVALDEVLEVEFDAAVTAADVSVTSAGVTGTVSVAGDGRSATFTPNGGWPADSDVTVDVSACGDSASTTFTTLPPAVDLADVLGVTYGVPFADVTVSEPQNEAAIKALLGLYVDEILLQINAVDGSGGADSIATIATYDGGGALIPDCDVAVRETADFSLNPFYQFQGQLSLVINTSTGATADIEDFELLGRVAEDGTSLDDVRISGLAAPEQFLPGQDCNNFLLQQLLSPTCAPCTISTSGQCMVLEIAATTAAVVSGFDLLGTCPP